MSHLGVAYETIETNANDGSTQTDEYLVLNANGKVPLLLFDDGRTLAESNAILLHLSEGSELIADDPWQRAKMYQWMFFEQYSHEPSIAVRRSLSIYRERAAQVSNQRMADLLAAGNRALSVMEQGLQEICWFTGARFGVADMALYAYTHVAGEGGYDLGKFPAVSEWLGNVAALERHITIEQT